MKLCNFLQALINFAISTPVQGDDADHIPIKIVSNLLDQVCIFCFQKLQKQLL